MAISAPLALPSAEGRQRGQATVLAALFFGTAFISLVGGLIAAFLAIDDAVSEFPPADTSPDNYTAVVVMITVAMASTVLEWALWAIRREERGHALAAYGMFTLLAFAGVIALWYLGSRLPFGVAESVYATLSYAMITVAGVVLVVAMLANVLAFLRVAGAQADPDNPSMPRAAAWLWHAAVLAWFGVFFTLYLFNLMFK